MRKIIFTAIVLMVLMLGLGIVAAQPSSADVRIPPPTETFTPYVPHDVLIPAPTTTFKPYVPHDVKIPAPTTTFRPYTPKATSTSSTVQHQRKVRKVAHHRAAHRRFAAAQAKPLMVYFRIGR